MQFLPIVSILFQKTGHENIHIIITIIALSLEVCEVESKTLLLKSFRFLNE